jgi:hypothetical protein
MSPNVLGEILPQSGRSVLMDNVADDRPEMVNERALGTPIPLQDAGQQEPIFLGIVERIRHARLKLLAFQQGGSLLAQPARVTS